MNIANSFIEEQIQKRMVLDNPWWETGKVDEDFILAYMKQIKEKFYSFLLPYIHTGFPTFCIIQNEHKTDFIYQM